MLRIMSASQMLCLSSTSSPSNSVLSCFPVSCDTTYPLGIARRCKRFCTCPLPAATFSQLVCCFPPEQTQFSTQSPQRCNADDYIGFMSHKRKNFFVAKGDFEVEFNHFVHTRDFLDTVFNIVSKGRL